LALDFCLQYEWHNTGEHRVATHGADPREKTVVLADDHAIVRQGTRQVLAGIANVEIMAEADNGLSAIAAVKIHQPDLLVLDAAMPMARGIEVFAEVRRWSPRTKVVLLTGFTSVAILSDWLAAGVDGILLKSCAPDEMKRGFETVLRGSGFVSDQVKELIANAPQRSALTNREREVLSLLATGNTNATIAHRLSISAKTVDKHRTSLMAKIGVHSVAELMVYALREGLLDEHKQL
jgi:DNA-binding NarL/FixJ family response regulator